MKRVLLDENLPKHFARELRTWRTPPIGVIVVVDPSTRMADLEPLLPRILAAIEQVDVGERIDVGR